MNSEEHLGNFNKENAGENISIGDILIKYIYHWPVFLVGIVLTLTCAFLYLRYTKPVYQISTALLIKDNKNSGAATDMLSQLDIFGGSKVVENEVEILQSKSLMRKVVNRLHLDVSYKTEGRVVDTDIYGKAPITFASIEMNPDVYNQELELTFTDSTSYLLKNISTGRSVKGNFNKIQRNYFGVYQVLRTSNFDQALIKSLKLVVKQPAIVTDDCLLNLNVAVASKQSTVLNLTFLSNVPQKGQDVLNTLIQVYNEAALADKNQTTQSTIRFIDERLQLITGELTSVEKDVESFKSENGLTDISNDAAIYLESVKTNDAQMNEVNIKLEVIKDIKRYIDSNSSKDGLPSIFGINDPGLLAQINQLASLQLERDKLLATTQANNPLVEPITNQIANVRESINSAIRSISSSLLGTKRELEANNFKYQGSIKKIPNKERQFISIKRQQSIKETLYLYLLQKREEAALSYASTVADSRIIDEAYSSDIPVKPKKTLTYLAALILGILLPVGYLYCKDLLNTKILKASDISDITHTPILGEIGYDEGHDPIVVTLTSRNAIAEQFRAIRTNMQFIHGKQKDETGRVTLLTSSMSGEGKSFVASNIASAFAISGRKTVLLELDLRKPKISNYLKLTNKTGLSNYLIGKADYKDIIQPTNIHENLFVIGSGPIPPNPSELIIHDQMEELIAYLKQNFDEIIVDTPPIGLVTDAQILARIADATIYIVRHAVTFKSQIAQLEKLYHSKKFPKLNVVLNGIKLGGIYGYGYGYGYYSNDLVDSKHNFKTILKNIYERF